MPIDFGTKAETLERVAPVLAHARVLPLIKVALSRWSESPKEVLREIERAPFGKSPLIVRSSARCEDTAASSAAGAFLSVPHVRGEASLTDAITRVAESYTKVQQLSEHFNSPKADDQVLIQPMLENVVLSGVAFSRDPNTGARYYVINYDDTTGSTSAVTAGDSNDLRTVYHFADAEIPDACPVADVIALLRELEVHFSTDSLDIEFARSRDGALYLLQVRPLTCARTGLPDKQQQTILKAIEKKLSQLNRPHPYLFGRRTVFGVMPDWNPAEIIGVRPNPLALSLYKEIITDSIWAYQRNNYGYKNLRSFPLLVDFAGLPYIDVRVSFNSFLPQDLDAELSEKLVNHYIDRLSESPNLHDKVEFDIIFSCYTLDLPERLFGLCRYGFSDSECKQLADSLRRLTNRIIHSENGLWKQDTARIEQLEDRYRAVCDEIHDPVAQVYWLLEDCKRYGTLPFAGLARAGFIAIQLLRSLINRGILSNDEYNAFLNSLDTVSSGMSRDLAQLTKSAFLKKYGHLRPGTYDILSPRYDEAPDSYFNWSELQRSSAHREEPFVLSLNQLRQTERLLKEQGLEDNVLGLFDFIKGAVEGREYAKFVFTRSLSRALSIFREFGASLGLRLEDCAMADIHCIRQLYASSDDARGVLQKSIDAGKEKYALTQSLSLPALITSERDVWTFERLRCQPNFVTLKSVTASVYELNGSKDGLAGCVVFIPNADPGYDWIFSHGIAGFVTMYGGTNSHMAIRAGELGIPAVIGCGETLYELWKAARTLELDCGNRVVRVIS